MKLRFALAVLLFLPGRGVVRAQTLPPAPTVLAYEVTTVKPNASDERSAGIDAPPGRYSNVNLRVLVAYAYSIPDEQLSGGPAWTATEHFDIVGKMSETDAAAFEKLDRRQQDVTRKQLLQKLLADRFALRVSHHPTEINGYALIVAKGGLRMKPSGQGPPNAIIPSCAQGCMMASTDPRGTAGSLAEALSSVLGRTVVDATDLKGTYEIDYVVPVEPHSDEAEDHASIRQAMEDQLGLKVVPRRVPAETIHIEAIDHPSPN